MSFEQLLSEIQEMSSEQETMSKALPAEDGKDDKIQAAAEEGGDMEGAGDGTEGAVAESGGEDEDEPMGKSLGAVTLENGETVEAIDGTELVKSLMARVESGEEQMQKALTGAIGLIKSQGEMIKSLSEQITKLSNAGRGRKAIVTVTEKTTTPMAKSEPTGMSGQEFMAKALSAQAAGRIRGVDVAAIEGYLNRGMQVPAHLIERVGQ